MSDPDIQLVSADENSEEKRMSCSPIRSFPVFTLCIDFMSIQIFCEKVMSTDPCLHEGQVADSGGIFASSVLFGFLLDFVDNH